MKTTIEEINGEPMTVVWNSEACANSISQGFKKCHLSEIIIAEGAQYMVVGSGVFATALPALPRHPKPEDAPLLYRYMAEGIVPMIKHGLHEDDYNPVTLYTDPEGNFCNKLMREITHATHNGERVEVVIND